MNNPGLRPWVLLLPPFAYGFGVNARCPGTVGFAAAWVVKLPLLHNGLLGAAAFGAAMDLTILTHILKGQFSVCFASVAHWAARDFINQDRCL